MKSPLELFDIKDKVAVITGASGAFGAVAARVLAHAGCKLVLASGKKSELDEIAKECEIVEVETVNLRPSTAENCDMLVAAAVKRFGRVDILVVASGKNDVAKIHTAICAFFQRGLVEAELFLPWSAQQLRGKIFANCEVLEERADNDGAFLRVRGEATTIESLQDQVVTKPTPAK